MQVSSCSHTPTGFMYFIYCYCIFFAGMSWTTRLSSTTMCGV
jgi:hypothetical protein